jgi:hypothetical protein
MPGTSPVEPDWGSPSPSSAWPIVAGFILLAIACDIDRQFIRSHPLIRSTEVSKPAVSWFLNSPLPATLFLSGWVMVFVGYWITGQALSDGSPEKNP